MGTSAARRAGLRPQRTSAPGAGLRPVEEVGIKKPLPPFRPLLVELVLPVRTYDVDFAGVVSNIVYIRWLEDLRWQLLTEYLPLDRQLDRGCAPVLSTIQIEYKRPIRLFDQPIGHLWIRSLRRVKWTVEAEIFLEGKSAATALQTGAFLDLSTMRPAALPDELVTEFERQAASWKEAQRRETDRA